jgi:drug/metabolite transporter (DMT)-like permease
MPIAAYAAMLAVVVLWGSAFPAIKIGLEDLAPHHLMLLRHLVAGTAFFVVLLAFGQRRRPAAADVPIFLALGFVGIFIYHGGVTFGELRVSAGATSLIVATAPAITALLSRFVHGDQMPKLGWAGSAISFMGVVLIVLGDGEGLRVDPLAFLVLLSAVGTSVYFVFQQPLFTRYSPLEVTAFVTWAGTVPMLLFLPGFVADVATAAAPSLMATVYTGLIASALAYTLFAFAQSRANPVVVSSLLYSVPVFAGLQAWWLIGEIPAPLTVAGGVLAISGIALVQHARRAARRKAAATVS